jgi:hypothetical protein
MVAGGRATKGEGHVTKKTDEWDDPIWIRDALIAQRLVMHELLRIIGGENPAIYRELAAALEHYAQDAAARPGYQSLEKHLRRLQTDYRVNSVKS